MGHIMIQLAANMDEPRAGGLYQRLRCAFNVTRPPGTLPFPPLEDWNGINAYCNNIPCTCVQAARKIRSVHQTAHYLVGCPKGKSHHSRRYVTLQTLPVCRTRLRRSIPRVFPGQQVELSFPPPLTQSDIQAAEQAELRDLDDLAQRWPYYVSEGAHEEASDAFRTPSTPFDGSPPEGNGAATAPAPEQSTKEDSRDHDIAAEDWIETTHALS